jgi:hypothetical protein
MVQQKLILKMLLISYDLDLHTCRNNNNNNNNNSIPGKHEVKEL